MLGSLLMTNFLHSIPKKGEKGKRKGERNQILENFRFVWKSTGQLEQMALLYIVF